MTIHRFEQHAMATAFEVILAGEDPVYAAQAAEAVFSEIHRLEDELSRFRPTSDIWRLAQLRAGESLNVSLAVWDCLCLAKAVHAETEGAFDITVGPLMHLWRAEDGSLREPDPELLDKARGVVGSHRFDLDEDGFKVTVLADHMVFDLGALGKGYALDQAAVLLGDWGFADALLNAGDSTLLALGNAPGEQGWTITLADGAMALTLQEAAVSGSGFHVKGAHLMDPRSLRPLPLRPQRSFAQAPSAALSDALSTAFAVLDPEAIQALCARHPGVAWLEV
jgi:thiamine biosynthesis lipoprotein